MKVLGIIESNITDPSWVDEYIEKVTPMLSSYGARYITRTDNIELVEGQEKPQFSVVSEFPSREIAHKFYNSPEYQTYKEARLKGSTSKFLLVDVENSTE